MLRSIRLGKAGSEVPLTGPEVFQSSCYDAWDAEAVSRAGLASRVPSHWLRCAGTSECLWPFEARGSPVARC